MWECPKCGRINPTNLIYCKSCDSIRFNHLSKDEIEYYQIELIKKDLARKYKTCRDVFFAHPAIICKNCGEIIEDGAFFCSSCGMKVGMPSPKVYEPPNGFKRPDEL